MGRRSDHSRKQIREMAIEAASRIVAADGIAALSTRRVAAEIGYSAGTLYLVFRNLDELILHVNLATLAVMRDTLNAALARRRTPATRVRALGRAYLGFARDNPHRWALVFDHRLPAPQSPPAAYRTRVRALLGILEAIIRPLDPDPARVALAARALWCGVHGVCVLGLTGKLHIGHERSMESLTDDLIDHFLRGFDPSPRRIPPC